MATDKIRRLVNHQTCEAGFPSLAVGFNRRRSGVILQHPLPAPTAIVKNVKKRGIIYPLAWDLVKRLCAVNVLKDEKIWAQDNQRLAPYGLGNAWVSNTFHHYCLQFRKE